MTNISKWIKTFSFLILGTALMMAFGCESLPKTKQQICLAKKGVSLMKVVLNSTNAIPAEKTAARELTTYLEKITGAKFEIIEEKDLPSGVPAIYLGHTRFAEAQGIDFSKLSLEESILRTVGKNLILTGGRPRGTLYAVYNFLENDLGCRWYTPWCEKVPSHRACMVPAIDRRSSPFFISRDMGTWVGPSSFPHKEDQWKWFVVRNRLNGQDISGGIWTKYEQPCGVLPWANVPVKEGEEVGGGWSIAGAGNHSFNFFIPTEKYFKDHPEYFSMRDGKRVPGGSNEGNHLCLTNPDVLKIMIEKVKEVFKQLPTFSVISVSINDGGCTTICDCPECRKVAKEEGESGLLLQFVNAVADAIKDEFPDKYILTLAYNPTAAPPKRIVARDNVIIYLCSSLYSGAVFTPTQSWSKPLTEWAKYARHIRCWDYVMTWTDFSCTSFSPVIWKLDEQFKLAKELGVVDGMYQENELMWVPPIADMYEMRMWISAKLMEDPGRNLDLLIEDFLNGYYGKAGPYLMKYIKMIKTRLPEWPYRIMDYKFMKNAQSYFDEAEAAVKNEPEYLARVKEWRVNVDITALTFRHQLVNDYMRQGGKIEEYPYRIAVLKERVLGTLEKTTHPYLLQEGTDDYKSRCFGSKRKNRSALEQTREHVQVLCQGKEYAPLPEQFQSLPADRVIDLVAPRIEGELVEDPEAALGLAIVSKGTNEMPMAVAVFDSINWKEPVHNSVQSKDVPGKGYHFYRSGKFSLSERTYVFLTDKWVPKVFMYMLYDPANPEQEWEAWASVKFTGPAYPYGDPKETNALYIDRVILTKVDSRDNTSRK